MSRQPKLKIRAPLFTEAMSNYHTRQSKIWNRQANGINSVDLCYPASVSCIILYDRV